MTQLSDKDHKAQMEDMASFDEQMPCGQVGRPIQDELSDLLEKEFSLPYFEFVYDEHWDLGHGWSGDMPK